MHGALTKHEIHCVLTRPSLRAGAELTAKVLQISNMCKFFS